MQMARVLRTIAVGAAVAAAPLMAQQDAPVLVIRGGTVHTLAGAPISNGIVVVRGGRIVAVGTDVAVPLGASVIEAQGQHIYPGFFDAITRLGLTEIGRVAVTNDTRELGSFNPHLLGATAVHPASEHIPVTRANGITHAVAAPDARSGGIGGQGSLISLDGWTVEEMLIEPSVGMILDWPTIQTRQFDRSTFSMRERTYKEAKEEYDAHRDSLTAWMEASRRYVHAADAGAPVDLDLKLEAMGKVIRGDIPLLVTANTDREIEDAIAFAEEERARIVILGGRESWKVAKLLAEKRIPVILGPTQSLPSGEDEPYDEQYAQPGKLRADGVTFAISTFNASSSRTLPYEAGTAVPYGLPADEALKAITLYPAQILGVGDRLGTIESGKLANFIVTNGDPLEIRTEVMHLVIAGRVVSLANKHSELYQKYKARPKR